MPLTIEKILASDNLANELDEKKLEKILSDAELGYREDVESRTDWAKRQDGYMELALQVVEQKNSPWPGAAKGPRTPSLSSPCGSWPPPAISPRRRCGCPRPSSQGVPRRRASRTRA